MSYAIMRCKKLATMGSVASSLQHCYRDRETPNADATRTPENEHHAAQSTSEAMGKLRELLPEKRRKDAVLAVEYVMTASPEWWKSASQAQQTEFFTRSKQWLADKYGADRIVTASIHRDEASPHLSAFVVPLTQDGRLSAKEFIGGRDKMHRDQTTFAKAVQELGLERGIEGSRATHQRVKSHYGAIERAQKAYPVITLEDLKPQKSKTKGLLGKLGLQHYVETPQGVAERLTDKVRGQVGPAIEIAATASQTRQRAKELRQTTQIQAEKIERLLAPFKGLNRDQMRVLVTQAAAMRQSNQIEQERKRARLVEQQRAKHALSKNRNSLER